ncbi:hypothetical protein R6Q59_004587 [Mikania micrantha]
MEAISMSLSVVWMVVVTVMVNLWWFFNWVWLRPKRMEKGLREQGLAGNRYRFLFGDLKEVAQMTEQAKLQPVKLSESIVPRVIPFYYKSANIYEESMVDGDEGRTVDGDDGGGGYRGCDGEGSATAQWGGDAAIISTSISIVKRYSLYMIAMDTNGNGN